MKGIILTANELSDDDITNNQPYKVLSTKIKSATHSNADADGNITLTIEVVAKGKEVIGSLPDNPAGKRHIYFASDGHNLTITGDGADIEIFGEKDAPSFDIKFVVTNAGGKVGGGSGTA